MVSSGVDKEVLERAKEVLEILRRNLTMPSISSICDDPFKILVRTIISQSTSEVNTGRAFERLASKIKTLTPKDLAEADIKDIEDALKIAGLYRNKSIILKRVSSMILEKFGGKLDFIYSLPLSEARKKLLDLPGVGPKTADIVLLFCARRPVLPVDTHVNRVSRRLGLVPMSRRGYESVRLRLEELYRPEDYFAVHVLFIALGRRFCKALKPLCPQCPLKNLCPSVER